MVFFTQKGTIIYLSSNGSNKVIVELLNHQKIEFKPIRILKLNIIRHFRSSIWLFVGFASIKTLFHRKLFALQLIFGWLPQGTILVSFCLKVTAQIAKRSGQFLNHIMQ